MVHPYCFAASASCLPLTASCRSCLLSSKKGTHVRFLEVRHRRLVFRRPHVPGARSPPRSWSIWRISAQPQRPHQHERIPARLPGQTREGGRRGRPALLPLGKRASSRAASSPPAWKRPSRDWPPCAARWPTSSNWKSCRTSNFLLAPILAIAKIATMLGLLLTVFSMIGTFNADHAGQGRPRSRQGRYQPGRRDWPGAVRHGDGPGDRYSAGVHSCAVQGLGASLRD